MNHVQFKYSQKTRKISRILISILVIIVIVIIVFDCLYASIEVKGNFSNRFYSDLKHKDSVNTVCVFVPHPDDEIWLAGTIIKGFLEEGIDVHVILYTDGLSSMQGERNLEVMKSCNDLGVKEENVHYLGYENLNQFEEEYPRGTRTPELRDSIKISIKNIIEKITPQLIIASDFDYNRDHRLYTILFDESIGEMLHQRRLNPKTFIWKGYCYNTSYYSERDYYDSINLLSTVKPTDVQNKDYETDVPQFLWKDRLRVPVCRDALVRSSNENYVMHAIKKHVTQHVRLKFLSCLNSDAVFWQRNVDNRFDYATIKVSSGEAKYLTDFKFYDCNDIRYTKRYNVDFTDCVWSPDEQDVDKTIDVYFEHPESISDIILYDNPSIKDNILSVKITVNDSASFIYSTIDKKGAPSHLSLNQSKVKHLTIKVVNSEGNNAGLVEIEAIRPLNKQINANKICDENGNFIYKSYLTKDKASYKLSYYSSLDSECSLVLLKAEGVQLRGNKLLFNDDFNQCTIFLKDKRTGIVYDTVEIERLNKLQERFWSFYKEYDELRLKVGDIMERNIFVQKILRVVHYPEGFLWK